MNKLHDRINRVINTRAFEACLEQNGIDLIDFQSTWHQKSQGGCFEKLPKAYQDAIIAGEKELQGSGAIDISTVAVAA